MKLGVTILGTSFGAQTEDSVQMHPGWLGRTRKSGSSAGLEV